MLSGFGVTQILFYEEWNDYVGLYTNPVSSKGVEAYSSTAQLRMFLLTDKSVQPVQTSSTWSPGEYINASAGSNYYSPTPDLWKTEQMAPFVKEMVLAICPSELMIKIGSRKIMLDVQEVTIAFKSIVDISPLSRLTNIQRLGLGKNRIADVSPLSGLETLNYLDLSGNELTDISPLSSLKALSELNLMQNNITDLSPLSELSNLRTLDLSFNEITDLTPLSGLISLVELYLDRNQIADYSPLYTMTGLKQLRVDHKLTYEELAVIRKNLPNCTVF